MPLHLPCDLQRGSERRHGDERLRVTQATMLQEIHLLTSERLTQSELLSGDGGPAAYVSKYASEMCSSLVQGNAAAAAALGVLPQLIFQPFPPRQLNVEVGSALTHCDGSHSGTQRPKLPHLYAERGRGGSRWSNSS